MILGTRRKATPAPAPTSHRLSPAAVAAMQLDALEQRRRQFRLADQARFDAIGLPDYRQAVAR